MVRKYTGVCDRLLLEGGSENTRPLRKSDKSLGPTNKNIIHVAAFFSRITEDC